MSLFKKKQTEVIKPSSIDRVQAAQIRVSQALDMFAKADEELTQANADLVLVIAEEQERLEQVKQTLASAQEELLANNALKVRISEFIR